ncbi:MAG: hypothetical protein SVV03_06720 [Candidatus Nanohaloarchaea archaeon]|nr:hypothetical protein [Candidatus Nanohaloarchaea archaeon]
MSGRDEEKLYDVLRDRYLEEEGQELTFGTGENYDEARAEAVDGIPEEVNLQDVEEYRITDEDFIYSVLVFDEPEIEEETTSEKDVDSSPGASIEEFEGSGGSHSLEEVADL